MRFGPVFTSSPLPAIHHHGLLPDLVLSPAELLAPPAYRWLSDIALSEIHLYVASRLLTYFCSVY